MVLEVFEKAKKILTVIEVHSVEERVKNVFIEECNSPVKGLIQHCIFLKALTPRTFSLHCCLWTVLSRYRKLSLFIT